MPAFDTPQPISATISFTAADVRVTATRRTDTVVEVRPADPADASDVAAAERARVDYAKGRLTVKDRSSVRSLPGRVAVTVELPSGSALDVSVRAGLLTGHGDLGEVRGHVSHGPIHLDHTGELHLGADHGDITVQSASGPATLTAGHGQIHIGQTGQRTVVNSGTGDVRVDRAAADLRVTAEEGAVVIGALTNGIAELSVATGTIDVGIPDGTAVVLDAKATVGRVRDSLGDLPEPGTGATVELHAHVATGDILLHRAAGAR